MTTTGPDFWVLVCCCSGTSPRHRTTVPVSLRKPLFSGAAVQFQLTINVAAVAMAVAGVLLYGESPLTPVQMLWINMIMDSLASVALATEAPTDAMLRLRPFSSTTPLLTPSCLKHICGQARTPLPSPPGLGEIASFPQDNCQRIDITILDFTI